MHRFIFTAPHLPVTSPSRRLLLKVFVVGLLLLGSGWVGWQKIVHAADASCIGSPITVPGVEKKLISLTSGSRPGNCIKPDVIFMHATDSGTIGTLDSNWDYFNAGAEGNHTNAQFIIGTDGKIYQTVELYPSVSEFAVTNDPFNGRSIGIEMVGPLEFANKAAMPAAQYSAALSLVQFLMKQYAIPVGEREYDWTSCDAQSPLKTGLYGHYQICGTTHTDPGQGWFKDFRADIKSGATGTTTASNPSLPGGRWVPYDAYARPFSWPVNGTIIQDYGITEQAQNLGIRYPGLYPKGDPGVIFSTTNHSEPPANAANDRFINPNIDIKPRGTDTLSRAVYSTQAGWITYADWAGENKGYTIQIESDVDGDGQADLATRYMRLQAPEGGFFAPDIASFHPLTTTSQLETSTGTCSDPATNDWKAVNGWDDIIIKGLAAITAKEKVAPSCNLVKAMMQLESGGDPSVSEPQGYFGLMQVGNGSNCDHAEYDITTNLGNVTCGIQHLTRDYKTACNQSWDGAILAFFTGQCDGNNNACDQYNCANDYLRIVKANLAFLDSTASKVAPPNVPAPSTQTSPASTTSPVVPLPPPFILEAESMEHDTKASQITDATASGGLAFKLFAESALTKEITIKADQIVVRAKGDQCGGAPTMVLKADGQEFARFDVGTTDWANFTANAPFDGGNHQYSISFINDFQILAGLVCDRNLYVDSSKLMVINPNTATTKTLSEKIIEAESLMQRSTPFDSLPVDKTDSTNPSGGKFVHMVDNSTIADKVTIKKGNWLVVRARGTSCNGAPHMVVKVDNTIVLEVDVANQDWTDYSTLLALSTSQTNEHQLAITFSNDLYQGPWCDRNLDVDVIKVQDNTVSQTTNNSNTLIGKTKYVGYNQLIGYVSVARDREKPGINVAAVPNSNQTYLSYRILYNNPNFTTFPLPDSPDSFINARVDNPYITETTDNTTAGNLKTAFNHIQDPMWFFCALRTSGNSVLCIDAPNP
jgi:hypothetical protein